MTTKPAPFRWWDPPAILFLSAMMIAAVSRLAITGWTFHLQWMYVAVGIGLLLGLALGRGRFSGLWSALFAALGGAILIVWLLGLTLNSALTWPERLISIVERLARIVFQLARQEPIPDWLMFITLMLLLFWVLSVHAGYTLVRHGHAWRIVLPVSLAVLLLHIYNSHHRYGPLLLALYFFLLLLVVARVEFLHRRLQWQQQRMHVPAGAGAAASRAAFTAALLLVLVAWLAPTMDVAFGPAQRTWQSLTRPWIAVRDRLSNAFVSLQGSPGVVSDQYGASMSLGLGTRLADDVAMTVLAPANRPLGVRYYWRAWVYDAYFAGRWHSTAASAKPETNLNVPNFGAARWEAEFVFTPEIAISTLYTAPQPAWVSRPFNVYANSNGDGTVDLSSLYAVSPLIAGDSYLARSSLSAATAAQLRAAGTVYPEWVKERYLQLPSTVTPRTIALAESIAGDRANPYDIAEAITAYLRANITYTETVSPPPADQEPIDWFLFDLRQGFCNYYASAEIILLRSLGIPARMAVGYAQGQGQGIVSPEFLSEGEEELSGILYTVRQRDAHAWPEVYFPGYGWVEFEPTAAQSPILRPRGEAAPSAQATLIFPTPTPIAPQAADPRAPLSGAETDSLAAQLTAAVTDPRLALSGASALVLSLVLVYLFWRKRLQSRPLPVLMVAGLRRVGVQPPPALQTWAARASFSPLERAYQELNEALIRLEARPKPADTPAERANMLQYLLPASGDSPQTLTREYQAAAYSPRDGNAAVAMSAARLIRRLSRQEYVRRLRSRLQRWPGGVRRE